MEEKFRRKALAGLVALLVVFGGDCVYITSIEPEREAILYISWDYMRPKLDSMNQTQYQAIFDNSSFLSNYSVEWGQGQYGDEFIIKVLGNPDVEIVLNHDNEDYYFMAIGYAESDALPGNENYRNLGDSTADELACVLGFLGHTVNPKALYWDDYFSLFPDFERAFVFFGLLTLIIIYGFMIIYKKGWLLQNFRKTITNEDLVLGLAIMYIATVLGLINIWYMSASPEFFFSGNCLVLYGMFLILGYYAISMETRKLTQ